MNSSNFNKLIKKDDFERFFWNRYLIYENDFINSFYYVDFSIDTFKTYSTYYIKLLLSYCIEIEAVLKLIFGSKKLSKKNEEIDKNMPDLMDDLLKIFPKISNNKVSCKEYNIEFYPFKIPSNKKTPLWWQNYNDLKHNRLKNYKLANLENTAYSLSCLFLLNILCFKEISDQEIWLPKKMSSLFTTDLTPNNILDLGNGLYFVTDLGELHE